MAITTEDVNWAIRECCRIEYWVLRSPIFVVAGITGVSRRRLTSPPSFSYGGGEGTAVVQIAWFSSLRRYRRTLLHYLGGYMIHNIEQDTARVPYINQRRAANMAAHLWNIVLHGRGVKEVRNGLWLSELQWEILDNEAVNERVFLTVERQLTQYIGNEVRRIYREQHRRGTASAAQINEQTRYYPGTFRRNDFNARNRNYGRRLHSS